MPHGWFQKSMFLVQTSFLGSSSKYPRSYGTSPYGYPPALSSQHFQSWSDFLFAFQPAPFPVSPISVHGTTTHPIIYTRNLHQKVIFDSSLSLWSSLSPILPCATEGCALWFLLLHASGICPLLPIQKATPLSQTSVISHLTITSVS